MKNVFTLQSKKELVYILLFAFFLYVPTWVATQHKFFRLDTDFDLSLATYYFMVDYVRSHMMFPAWNPYVGTGVPVIGDPTSVALNPVLTPLILGFGVENGLRLTIFVMYMLAGIGMWLFLTSIGVYGWLRLWGSLLYTSAGNMVAYIRAGHIPEILTFPAVPLIFIFLVKPKLRHRQIIMLSLLLTYIFFSGYTYLLWFTLIFIVVLLGYRSLGRPLLDLLKSLFSYGEVLLLFIIFSSIKLYPFVHDVLPNMERFFHIDPYKGSIHSLWYPLGWIVPFQTMFYDRPFFRRLFGFYYNWYEYYAFITPLPFIFLTSLGNLIHKPLIRLFLVILATGSLYIALQYQYSPFYWIYHAIPFARTFRVPQRISGPTTAIIIALLVLGAEQWFRTADKRKRRLGICLCLITIVWTFFNSQRSLLQAFENPRDDEQVLAKELRGTDPARYYVATFVCCEQVFLVQEKIPVINFYFAWRPKKTPNYNNLNDIGFNYDMLRSNRPKYVIASPNISLRQYEYHQFKNFRQATIWKTETPNLIPETL